MLAIVGRAETIVENVRKTIQFTENALELFDSATGKLPTGQAVIILGPTGVGKSTLIHLLAGDKLHAIYDQKRGRIFIDAEPSPSTAKIKIGHQLTAETQIPNKWVDKEVTYWDCPGWFDNRGVGQEIANAVCIKKVFDVSQKVKILFMITDAQLIEEARPRTLLLFIKTLHDMFSEQVNQIKGSVALVVSHANEERTEEHVIHRINRVIEECGFVEDPGALLEALTKQPIIIFKKPRHIASRDRYSMDTGKMRADVLNKIEKISYATGVRADVVVSLEAQVTLTHSYHALITEINKAVKQFADMFKQCVDDFAASYTPQIQTMDSAQRQKAQLDLDALINQLNQVRQSGYEITAMPAVITSCLDVALFCQKDLSADGLIQALKHIEVMEKLEEFVNELAHTPIDIVKYMREQIEYTLTKLEILKINIIAVDAQDKAQKEKERAEIATRRLAEEKAWFEAAGGKRKKAQSDHAEKKESRLKFHFKWKHFWMSIFMGAIGGAKDYAKSHL